MVRQTLTLTRTTLQDLENLYQFQQDEVASHVAALTSKETHDKTAFMEKHARFLADPTINMRSIKLDDVMVGSIAKFVMEGDPEITYWLDRNFWGKGIATAALQAFLKIEKTRPLFGRVAFDNVGSQKVLEKGGFLKIGQEKSFAHARQTQIEEYIYQLSQK